MSFRKSYWLLAFAFLAVCAVTGALRTAEPAAAAEGARVRSLGQANDPKDCLNCHDDPKVTGVLHTAHAAKGDPRTAFTTEGCQSCHGASEAHMGRPAEGQARVPPEIVFTGVHAAPVAARNKLCLNCHEASSPDQTNHWQGSAHAGADVACTNCHASHPAKDPVLVKTSQAPICFTCHAEQRAANLRPSHHPVIEGVMTCADCHNAHGSDGPNLIKTATVNDLCLTCHDEKRGPFLWEHAPVQEQCTICHTPHGSVQARLLKQRPPYLCQTCHLETLHNSQPMSGNTLPGAPAASRIMALRACLNCHTEIHGSNHPSGIRFAR
jgi:DmsE family decaheme c-type cytochrome